MRCHSLAKSFIALSIIASVRSGHCDSLFVTDLNGSQPVPPHVMNVSENGKVTPLVAVDYAPKGICFDTSGNMLVAISDDSNKLINVTTSGLVTLRMPLEFASKKRDMLFGPDGELYMATDHGIQKYAGGTNSLFVPNVAAYGMAFSPDAVLFFRSL